jgi:hypothetical protein
MKIGDPVIKGVPQRIAAKNQPEYIPLPYIRDGKRELTRYTLSIRERIKVLFTGSIYLELLTSEEFVHPRKLSVDRPKV